MPSPLPVPVLELSPSSGCIRDAAAPLSPSLPPVRLTARDREDCESILCVAKSTNQLMPAEGEKT